MQSPQLDVKEYGYFAGNQWRKAAGDRVFEVHEPYTGKLFARVAAGTRADGRTAVDAAAKAFPEWAETTPAEKARLFLKASEIVKRRRSEIAEVLARETGSTISFATFQQDLVAATLQQVAGWVYLPKGEVLETNAPGSHSIGVRRPLGVVASFTPWNGANVLSWRAVISPVAAGNTVVVKPSEFAPMRSGNLPGLPRPASDMPSAPAKWTWMIWRLSTYSSACTASQACAWPTRPSCRGSLQGRRMRPLI
jgi:acyl-CoA reductase-like NAD-dependent aldehyde dehydrogenase